MGIKTKDQLKHIRLSRINYYGAATILLVFAVPSIVSGYSWVLSVKWGEAWGFAPRKNETKTEPLHPAVDTVWVMRSDGAQSCDPQSGISLAKGAEDLKAANIPILESRKGNDGRVHVQVCGAYKGSTNAYRIPRKNVQEATALGYQEMLKGLTGVSKN